MAHKKVWDSCFLKKTSNVAYVSFHLPGSEEHPDPLGLSVEFSNRYNYVLPGSIPGSAQDIDAGEYPDYMYLTYETGEELPSKRNDAFIGAGGLIVVSGAMYDILQGFNLGATRLQQIPLRQHDQRTPVEGRWYFLHIRENRNCLIAEESTGVEATRSADRWRVNSEAKYHLTVEPTAAADLDLWYDSRARSVLFFSDRLKEAIERAGLSFKSGNDFRACKVV